MGRNEKKYGTIGLMILTVIIIFSVVGIVIAGFRMIKKNEDARLISSADTEYNKDKEKRQEIEDHLESDGTQEANTETETKGESEEAASDSETDNKEEVFSADENENASSDEEADGETEDRIYLIPGDDKSSNRYEKAQHLSYTTTVKYTIQNLSVLDSYGLKITRNEIYARHGRIFNDQELQEYFQRQNWYVPQTASNDFDDSCLNEVEKYNIQLISTYEQQAGGN